MQKLEALYYPNIEPPIEWLKSAALFFDLVMSFVPSDSDDILSQDLCEFAERTSAWIRYRSTGRAAPAPSNRSK